MIPLLVVLDLNFRPPIRPRMSARMNVIIRPATCERNLRPGLRRPLTALQHAGREFRWRVSQIRARARHRVVRSLIRNGTGVNRKSVIGPLLPIDLNQTAPSRAILLYIALSCRRPVRAAVLGTVARAARLSAMDKAI